MATIIGLLAPVTVRLIEDALARPPTTTAPTPSQAAANLAGLPMAWVPYAGDTPGCISATGLGYSALLADTEAVVNLAGDTIRLGFVGANPSPEVAAAGQVGGVVSNSQEMTRVAGRAESGRPLPSATTISGLASTSSSPGPATAWNGTTT